MSSSALAATGKTAEGWDQPGAKLPSATGSVQNSLICPAFPPRSDVRATGVTRDCAWRVSPRGPPTGSCNVLQSLDTPRGQSLLRGCGLTKSCLIILFTHAAPGHSASPQLTAQGVRQTPVHPSPAQISSCEYFPSSRALA